MNNFLLILIIGTVFAAGGLSYYLLTPDITLKSGDRAFDFELQDSNGQVRTLSEFKGSPVVLYFFPKSGTPGCTKQACSLRDTYADFAENNIVVLGVSYDSVAQLDKFKKEYRLPFYLLSDSKKKVAALYGANRPFWMNVMPHRITFIIDQNGQIAEVLPKISIDTHASEILEFIKAMKD